MNPYDTTLQLNDEQENALRTMLIRRDNCLLTGEAGTGKSLLVSEFQERYKFNLVSLALNEFDAMSIGGETVQSFFGFKTDTLNPDEIEKPTPERIEIWNCLDAILIDGFTMLRHDTLDKINRILKEYRPSYKRYQPFAGVRIIGIGDLSQLPPVRNDAQQLLIPDKENITDYIFYSDVWSTAHFNIINLSTVYRQADPFFLKIISRMRCGKRHIIPNGSSPTERKVLNTFDVINQRCFKPKKPNAIRICLSPQRAQKIHEMEMHDLNDSGDVFTGHITGDFRNDATFPDINLLIKRNMQVMLRADQYTSFDKIECRNGDIGTVVDYRLGENPVLMIRLNTGKILNVFPHTWYSFRHEIFLNEKIHPPKIVKLKAVGSYTQFPVIPAYALTLREALSIPLKSIHLDLENGCTLPGELYSAFSRVRSFDDLTLEKPVTWSDFKIDNRVLLILDACDALTLH